MVAKVIIVNDKGGVGKSTLAQLVALYVGKLYGQVRIVEYDRQPKLHRFFGSDNVVSNSIAPDWETQLTQPERLASFWDPLVRWLRVARPLVIDFGAQGWGYFAAWARSAMLGDLIDTSSVIVLVPVTADIEAISGAQRVLDQLPQTLPNARVCLLTCDKDGEFASLKGVPAHSALLATAAKAGAAVVSLPVLMRDGYAPLAACGLRFDVIAQSKPNDLAVRTGLPPVVAGRAIRGVQSWLEASYALLETVIGQPKQTQNRAAEPG